MFRVFRSVPGCSGPVPGFVTDTLRAITNSQKVELVKNKYFHTIGGVDWHLPNPNVMYLRSAFLLFDAAIFCLEALKQIILDLIDLRIFSLL